MPTYNYHCEACGHQFEQFQSITAKTLKKCPRCGKLKLNRTIGLAHSESYEKIAENYAPASASNSKTKDMRVPAKEEIAQLPLGAQVAFAARCARRVQPLFTFFWPGAPKKHVDALEKAILFAERFDSAAAAKANAAAKTFRNAVAAEASDAVKTFCRAVAPIIAASNAAGEATEAVRSASISEIARAVVYAVASSSRCAADIATTLHPSIPSTITAIKYTTAIPVAAKKISSQYNKWERLFIQEIRQDYDKLIKAVKKEKWAINKSVEPEFFGSMWPDGKPEGWPETKQISAKTLRPGVLFFEQPAMEFYIKPGKASKETILEVFNALSEYHRAMGGLGLEFTFDGQYVYAREGVNV